MKMARTGRLRRVLVGSSLAALPIVACSSSGGPSTVSDAGASDASTKNRDASSRDATASDVVSGQPDTASPTPDAGRTDAALPDAPLVDAPVGCGDAADDVVFTCSGDGNSRLECAGGALVDQACPNGCLREAAGQDAICMGTTATNWSCTGAYGTVPVDDGNYYLTEFGCWVDDAGTHTDPDDNCIPACLAKAQAAGLCDPNGTGPACEEALSWYTADGARFGCLQHLRVTNPANGRSLIAIALDYGPGCTGENDVQHAALDASGLVNDYLFGSAQGRDDHALVHVVEVDNSTPLGPED